MQTRLSQLPIHTIDLPSTVREVQSATCEVPSAKYDVPRREAVRTLLPQPTTSNQQPIMLDAIQKHRLERRLALLFAAVFLVLAGLIHAVGERVAGPAPRVAVEDGQ